MGIYISDMQIPTSCSDCRFCADKWCYVIPEDGLQIDFCRSDRRLDWCPLICIPKHGDLIDFDFCMNNYEALRDDDGNMVYAVRMRDLLKAPTIIHADTDDN